MIFAITREVSPGIESCELTHLSREAIDIDLARLQHSLYEECLVELGCKLHRLKAEPHLPDSVFVEDTAIVLDELAIIARPGAKSRQLETSSIADVFSTYRKLVYIEPPGTLDGGDVLCVGKTVYVGLSSRSNSAGLNQLHALLAPYGYAVKGVPVEGCLHLKSAASRVGENALLVNRAWVDTGAFTGIALIDIDPSEPLSGNALLVGNIVIYPSAYSGTRKRLEQSGITVKAVDLSELSKAEGGVTCCSLIFNAR